MSAPNVGDSDSLSILPKAFQNGLTSILVCSSVSLFATSSLLIVLAWKAIREFRNSRKPGSLSSALRGTYSIHTQGYFWLVNLFIADFIQSLGLVIVGHTLAKNSVHAGPACTVQGFLINSGDIGSAIWSFVIAVHTFFLLAGGRKWRTWVAERSTGGKGRWVLCIGIWLFIIFIGVIGLILIEPLNPDKGPFYDNAGAGWCWIGKDYYYERIFFHYIFLFIDMFALTILYCILFFYIRVQLKNFRKAASSSELQSNHELQGWQANLEAGVPEQPAAPKQIITTQTVTVTTEERPIYRRTMRSESDRAHRRMNQVALTLLCYPIMFICLTMPLCVTRLSQFAGNKLSLASVHAGASLYCCTGFVNVLLYTATRKGIISWDWLFKRCKSGNSTQHTAPPPYNPHYPGSPKARRHSDSTLHLPSSNVVSPKPSAMSVASIGHPPPAIPSSPGSRKSPIRDSDSDFEFDPENRVTKGSSS